MGQRIAAILLMTTLVLLGVVSVCQAQEPTETPTPTPTETPTLTPTGSTSTPTPTATPPVGRISVDLASGNRGEIELTVTAGEMMVSALLVMAVVLLAFMAFLEMRRP